eukprot:5770011-Alexandrium_andersonii.AAC.1
MRAATIYLQVDSSPQFGRDWLSTVFAHIRNDVIVEASRAVRTLSALASRAARHVAAGEQPPPQGGIKAPGPRRLRCRVRVRS